MPIRQDVSQHRSRDKDKEAKDFLSNVAFLILYNDRMSQVDLALGIVHLTLRGLLW